MGDIYPLIVMSVREPRKGVRYVLDAPLGESGRRQLFLLATILPALLISLGLIIAPADPEMVFFPSSPFLLAGVQAFALLVLSGLVYFVGRARGGRGSFSECLAAAAWLQVVMSFLQAGLLLLELALPSVAAVVAVAVIIFFMWMLIGFIAEVHSFTSLPKVLGAVVLTLIGVWLFLTLISTLLVGLLYV
ncbi:YIP1 family protein [Falsirhodobacter sp. alg1]|uniref:YIP1 family protein n=1 Tax=Falsirhodobacter sp. alg1 TaxID=1472418 RepID=UPI000786F490|nr:YIP1 family protein [Falsirhodobacter sp. alg1]